MTPFRRTRSGARRIRADGNAIEPGADVVLALFLLFTSNMTALRFIQIAIGAPAASAGFGASLVPPFCLAFLLSTVLLHAIHRLRSGATVVGHANADRR